jgi:surface protein
MMHKLFKNVFSLFILLLAGVQSMSAQQVTKETALLKATQFFNQSDVVSRRATRKAPQFTLANNCNEFYIFNDEANGGYVVVSGDERMPDVLGYSYTGYFDAENIPCNLKAWLEDYAAQVAYLRTHPDVPASRRTTPERDEISPLLNCHFNQGRYYNEKCPIVNGEHCVTGCVATAMAQIMYNYQWPKQTTEAIPAYTTEGKKIDMPAIPVTTIDWDNMLDKYSSWVDYSDEQIDAISNLMLLCGTSVYMDYDIGSSGAQTISAAIAFRKYFDYDDLVENVARGVNLEAWEQMLYDELNHGRPVMYGGLSETGGHAFILDGYKDGYFHVNWGWGGYQDDYFLLTDLNGYNYAQDAIIGIQPANSDIPSRYAVFDNGKMTLYYDTEMNHRSGTVLPHQDDWSNYKDQITECVIDPSFANLQLKSLNSFFYGWGQLKSIEGLENLNTSLVMDMGWMFYGCSSLTSLDVSGFKTDNVRDMGDMFNGCSALTSLDVSGFKTDNVTYMANMFYGCSALTTLDVSGFKTDNVIYMDWMFFGCSGLTSLDVSGFKTDNVTGMTGMFYGCSGLTTLDVSGFKTDNVTSMNAMFFYCSSLKSLDVSGFKTDKVTGMIGMFYDCLSLTSLDVSGFKTDNVTSMSGMFYDCSNLMNLDVSGFKTENVKDMSWMFYNCSSLTSLDVSGFKTDNVTDMSVMFYGCSNLASLDVSGFKTDNVTTMYWMFGYCESLTSLDVTGFKMSNVTNMDYMFYYCSNLTSITMPNSVTNIGNYAFSRCSVLTSVTIGSRIESIGTQAFTFCTKLTDVYCYAINVPNTDTNAFKYSSIENATLHVPAASVDAYKAVEPWKNFKEILEVEDNTKGDVDGDGVVDLADAVLVINHYVGKPVAKFNEKAADVDGDGVIDLADAVRIINFYVGKVQSLAPSLDLDGLDPQ